MGMLLSTTAASCGVGEPCGFTVTNAKSFPGPPLRARLDLFVAVVTMPAAESAHEGGPVRHQCQTVSPLLFDGLAAAPNQTRRVYWHSRLVRLTVAKFVAASLVCRRVAPLRTLKSG